jgi:uncharacterized membrane protein YphA (DoxX/SURF4 family)
VQRLFSTFPSGTAGLGLLILRLFLFIRLGVDGITTIGAVTSTPFDLVVAIVKTVCAAATVTGFLTPVTQIVITVVAAFTLFKDLTSAETIVIPPWPTLSDLTVALSLALLGPGAYSVDARMFGRREIVLKPRIPAGRKSS